MRRRSRCVAALCGAGLLLAAPGAAISQAQSPLGTGLSGTSPIYGYQPLERHYGPVEAQRELENLTYQPEVRGLDYGYGVGYFFGFGPPKQYRTHTLQGHARPAAAQGLIDARWTSGYVSRGHKHHACGYFAVGPGCNCLTPTQYRNFAPLVVPETPAQQLGGSWYTGAPLATVPAAVVTPDSVQDPLDQLDDSTSSPDELSSRVPDAE